MTEAVSRGHVESFRALIGRRLGLHYDGGRLDALGDLLRQRTQSLGFPRVDMYLDHLASVQGAPELRALAEPLTVGETFFFRNADHFRAFTEMVLPDRLRARSGERRLRFLSAGCATGEEPYTLAMLLRERLPEIESWDVQIRGVDLNPASLAKAQAARYTSWALRATTDEVRDRYFRPEGRDFVLDTAIRKMVTFEERNLNSPDPAFWRGLECDAIFCRNVIMYFTPEAMNAVVQRLTQGLLPGGYLFLGHAETLRGLSQDFHLCHTHDTFYYQRRGAHEPRAPLWEFGRTPVPVVAEAPLPYTENAASWFEVIQNASERITNLAEGHSQQQAPGLPPPSAPPRPSPPVARLWDRSFVLELIKQERFMEALALLGDLPADARKDPDALLVRAVLLTNSGRLAESEEICRELLALDDLNSGAHYLMALCREHAADLTAAIEHDQSASYLDSGFAMPHLHLGLLARRTGDLALAKQELGLAQVLLVREDAPRILLFGGGFSRETLMALCKSELHAAGGDR